MKELLLGGVIAVAGLSSRMGDFKPLLPFGDSTIIESALDSMLLAGVCHVAVVVGFRGEEIERRIADRRFTKGQRVDVVYNLDYAVTDMLKSIKVGLDVVQDCDAFFVLPGDMPAVSRNTFLAVKREWVCSKAKIVFPTIEGFKKHPPLIDRSCMEVIFDYDGDGGLREIFKMFEQDTSYIPVDDVGCTMDADTKVDYENLIRYMVEGGSENETD